MWNFPWGKWSTGGFPTSMPSMLIYWKVNEMMWLKPWANINGTISSNPEAPGERDFLLFFVSTSLEKITFSGNHFMGTKLCYHENPLEERTGILYIYRVNTSKKWPGGVGASDFVDRFLETQKRPLQNQKHSIWTGNVQAYKIQTLNPTFAGTSGSGAPGPSTKWFNVLKTQNTTKSKTWLKVSSKVIPNMPLYKSKTCLEMIQNTHPSPTKKAVPNVNMFDFVGEIVGGILYIYI